MRVLLTGATGFIGRHLLRELARTHDVVALTREATDPTVAAEWVVQDLVEPLDERRLPATVDAVVHLAQSIHYKEFPERADDIFAVNVQGTFRLLEWAARAGAARFVFASTGGVYGHGEGRLSESDPVSLLDFYFRSKYASELLLEGYAEQLSPVVLRPFFVYGAGQQRMLMPTLAGRVLAGEPVTVHGDPGLRINPIHVDDAVRAFAGAIEHEAAGVFNVAGSEALSITELVERIAAVAGVTARIEHTPDEPPGDLVGDITRMRTELGVEPRVSLEEGLSSVLAAV